MLKAAVFDHNGIVIGVTFDETYISVKHVQIYNKSALSGIQRLKHIQSEMTDAVRFLLKEFVERKSAHVAQSIRLQKW